MKENERRSRIEIGATILEYVKEKRRRKTRVMYNANLDTVCLSSYLEGLEEDELITVTKEGRKVYVDITDKGKKFLGNYRKFYDESQPLAPSLFCKE